jgi:ubiquinone/menaquinone biosynthesis C-methylase UbiE
MGELRAVLDPNASEVTNTAMHGASLVGAKKALTLMRAQEFTSRTVLDFGCGTGRMLRFFAGQGCQVIGADVTFEMLEATKHYGLPSNCLLVLFDGVSLPLRDHSIDIIWVCSVLKYTLFPPGSLCVHGHLRSDLPTSRFVPTCARVAKEMYRVLKPGGIVANYELWINEPPELFNLSFEQAGFLTEQVKLLRRNKDNLINFYKKPGARMIPPLFASTILANYRYYFDDPHRAGFRDYFIVWRKPFGKIEFTAANQLGEDSALTSPAEAE